MSDPVTALDGAVSDAGIATITEVPLQGMITLRGDLSTTAVKNAATGVAAVDMPGQGEANCVENRGICWMSPDELLVLCPYETVAANIELMQKTLGDAHALAVNVSDARASFRVGGGRAREVIAKLCPVDLSPDAFKPGMFRRTRMAQVPAAFWMRDEDSFQIICFRSQAQYVFDLLTVAAQPGSEVNL
ncbi:sarcosine oxidase subunit gamma [Roseobacter sp. EG26]|uniref:sarcosine oxidase subunit gamma n=1 Tax=Roseobacter sp. EG26 TaxID=3412477 RepID=UPI003CE518A4